MAVDVAFERWAEKRGGEGGPTCGGWRRTAPRGFGGKGGGGRSDARSSIQIKQTKPKGWGGGVVNCEKEREGEGARWRAAPL